MFTVMFTLVNTLSSLPLLLYKLFLLCSQVFQQQGPRACLKKAKEVLSFVGWMPLGMGYCLVDAVGLHLF
jgi:TRAP-type C4-dicarboxylate transport system permease large subunit